MKLSIAGNPSREKFSLTGKSVYHGGQDAESVHSEVESRQEDLNVNQPEETKTNPQTKPANQSPRRSLNANGTPNKKQSSLNNKDDPKDERLKAEAEKAKVDLYADLQNPPNKLSSFIYDRPMICMFIWGVIIAILVSLFFDYDLLDSKIPQYRHYAIPDTDDQKTWDIKRLAELQARSPLPNPVAPIANQSSIERQYLITRWQTVILLDCSKCQKNLLSPEGLRLLSQLQTKISTGSPSFSKFCLRTTYENPSCDITTTRFLQSPIALFQVPITAVGGINNLNQQQIDATILPIINNQIPSLPWSAARQFFGREVTAQNPRTQYMRFILNFAGPIAGYSSPDDRTNKQEEEFKVLTKEIQDALDAFDRSLLPEIKIYQYSPVYADDQYSSVLGGELMLLIGLFLLSFFLLTLRFNYSVFLALNTLVVILLSVVGSMVFTQLVFQVEYFTKAYLLLFFFVFGCGINNAVMLWDVYMSTEGHLGSDLQRFSTVFREGLKKVIACNLLGIIATIALDACKIIPVKVIAYQSALSLVLLTVFMALFQFWALVFQHKVISGQLCARLKSTRLMFRERNLAFVRGFTQVVWVLRFPIFVLTLAFIGVSIAYSVNYERLEKVEVPFRESHHLYDVNDLLYEKFSPPLYTTVTVMFGVSGVSKTSSRFDFDDFGTLEYDSSFDVSEPATQTALLNFCQALRLNQQFNPNQSLRCWILSFRDFLAVLSKTLPLATSLEFNTLLQTFLSTSGKFFVDNKYVIQKDNRVVFTKIDFTTLLQLKDDPDVVLDERNALLTYISTQSASFTAGMRSYKVTSTIDWSWADSRKELRSYQFKVFPIVIAMSLVIFLAALQNPIQVFIVVLGSLGARVSLIAITNWAGWQAGTYEQFAFVVPYAISSQYTLLIGLAYAESQQTERRLRLQEALNKHLFGIISAAVTTIASSLFLIDSQFYVIYQVIFTTTVGFALNLYYSIFFVTSAHLIFGPIYVKPADPEKEQAKSDLDVELSAQRDVSKLALKQAAQPKNN